MIRVVISNRQRHARIAERRLRSITRQVLKGEGITAARISLVLLDDSAIHRINKQFLNHDEPTDVITFPLSESGEGTLRGELLISGETAKRMAKSLGHPAADEAALYTLHGLLHLCGYDDIKPKDRREMRRRERHYLDKLRIVARAVDT